MADMLLRTKLFVPPLRLNLVSRPHLIERLNHGLKSGHKLTLVSAPAGFGKSTLLNEWVRQAEPNICVAWLSLDEGDNDLNRFFTYFIAALQTIQSNIGQELMIALHSPDGINIEGMLTRLLNEITEFTDNVILILDDFHVIESPPIDKAITFLLEHLPAHMQLVIASRIDPSISLSRLRARGQITELRAKDLRFTYDEAATFLNQVVGLELSSQDVAALETRTEGWIVGLQLAALSMQGFEQAGDISDFVARFTGSDRYIQDYLTDEVLQQLPQETRDFLLHTSILRQLSGPLCDAVRFGLGETTVNEHNSQSILENLESANLFTVPLDNERHWYRYHHLFAELLRRRLRENEPDIGLHLHHRASKWFAKQGLNREALHHSFAAKDYQRAADLIKTLALEILQRGEHTTVSGWINALPESLIKEQPYLCVFHAWTLQLTGQFEATEARLSDAEEALANYSQENDEDATTIRGHIHFHQAYLTFIRGEHAKTIIHAHQALAQLPPDAKAIRTQTALYLGVAYRNQGELQAAMNLFTEAVAASQTMGGSMTAVLSYLNLAELYTERGHLHQSKGIYEQALQFTRRHSGRSDMPFTGYLYVGLGRILRQWNRLDDAYHHTARGVALCRDWNVSEIVALSCIELAYINHAHGNNEQARVALQEAKQIFDGFSSWGSKSVAAHQARLDLARGEVESAERWAQANDLNSDDEIELRREIEYLTLARVFMAQNRFEPALSLLGRLHEITLAIGKMQSVMEVLALQAMALSAQGHRAQALIKLDQALAIGEPENYVCIFLDEGPSMAKLLAEWLEEQQKGQVVTGGEVSSVYVYKLLAAIEAGQKDDANPSPQPLVEPLSPREIEVLHLVAQGFSNREISKRLYLALDTVKGHNRRIFGKLGVKNRAQAVKKAVSLKIIPPLSF